MQLYKLDKGNPTSAQTWNWRENLKAGIELYNKKRAVALSHPKIELDALNENRAKLGLPACTNPLPPLAFEQLEREVVRLYNCGFEYYWETANAQSCEGKWIISPSCERKRKPGYDPKYVNNVLKCDINH